MKSDSQTTWKCSYCDKQFKYKSEKTRHEQSHAPQFECKVCAKKFSFLSALRRHEKQHERTGSVQCSKCGGNFRDETLLRRHVQYAHKGTHSCSKCSATFNSEAALRTHMKTHRPESERRFRCSYQDCHKTFNFPHHLKHHELTHTDQKQYFCKICHKGFIQAHHLKVHEKIHEPDNWLPCFVKSCKKKFSNEYARKRHLNTHKNKSDGCISSDSNSAYDLSLKDSASCTCCGHMVSLNIYKEHIQACIPIKEEENMYLSISPLKIDIETEDLDRKVENLHLDANLGNVKDVTEDFSSCKTVIGDKNSSCAENNTVEYSTPKIDEKKDTRVEVIRSSVIKLCDIQIENQDNMPSKCVTCECASICFPNVIDSKPKIELRTDGIVKLKGTFDLSFGNANEDTFDITVETGRNEKDLLYSCKDVLGNCIVSGTGAIDEECLCAKMAVDQPMSAQEIEDITPCPKDTWFRQRL